MRKLPLLVVGLAAASCGGPKSKPPEVAPGAGSAVATGSAAVTPPTEPAVPGSTVKPELIAEDTPRATNAGVTYTAPGGWTLTAPNADYLLVPNGTNPILDPSIDPADPANNPALVSAPLGFHFTGVKQIGDTATDLKVKLAHAATPIAVPGGTTIQVTVFANRGRLEPFDTPASTADVLVRIFGWTAGSLPTVTAATDNWSRTISWNPASQSFDFTGIADGTWGSRTFSFTTPAATTLAYLSISLAGRNNNHDQYVALDLCEAATPAAPSTWGQVKGRYR